ncbi:MAG: MMPL family transporter [Deltaproteobacteria bacterium]|nr:MMPL family transporter [Deltaproteobacteria bacterium]MBI3388140.1 MMPL family transporter [Deltaproteobacteria bacterium]
MTEAAPDRLSRFFAFVIAKRWWVLALYAVLVPPSAYFAAQVGQDNSIDRLIVATDPDFIATRQFEQVFGSGEFALLIIEADDPLSPAVIARVDAIEHALQPIARVHANSALSVFRRAKAGFQPTSEQIEAFRQFATGTDLFRHQGLLGDHYLAVGLVLEVSSAEDRLQTLAAIERAIASVGRNPAGPAGMDLHELGQPYVNVYLDETQRGAWKYFVLFVAFVIVLNISSYRSPRTLAAFLITLGVCLAVSLGYVGITGGTLTIVSPMVPMTILVTATATLVYLHSRFVDRPAERSVAAHQVFALTNKFVACTASIFATAVGFAALLVSDIRPIREMGAWVAVGLGFTWIIVFTLFPALQTVLKTPTQQERRAAGAWFIRVANWLPRFTYRWRWPLVGSSLLLSALGAIALFGAPGIVAPLRILTDPVEYMDHDSPLYRDIRRLGNVIPGLSITQVWLKGGVGSMSEPAVLNGLHDFQQTLEHDPDIGAAVGPTTILRIIRYIGGAGDDWPTNAEELNQLAGDLEGMASTEPMLQRFVQAHGLSQAQLTVISRTAEHEGFERLAVSIRRHWADAVARNPALKELELKTVGLTPLHAKMAQGLVPTLVESFGLTVMIIFAAFLVVFRNGAARLMAMIPSIFAILVMFLVMRLTGLTLNIATILIASTVLGTSENDQIHFFYHFLERRRDGTVEQALQHTLLIAGRAIFFATMINAGGFLAFGLADLPPMRQFGVLAALAFVLSMVADFTALPAALWILFRAKPDAATTPSRTAEAQARSAPRR